MRSFLSKDLTNNLTSGIMTAKSAQPAPTFEHEKCVRCKALGVNVLIDFRFSQKYCSFHYWLYELPPLLKTFGIKFDCSLNGWHEWIADTFLTTNYYNDIEPYSRGPTLPPLNIILMELL